MQPGDKDANKQEISQLDALKNPERTRQEQAATKAQAAFKGHFGKLSQLKTHTIPVMKLASLVMA